jgi:hypothetical protein
MTTRNGLDRLDDENNKLFSQLESLREHPAYELLLGVWRRKMLAYFDQWLSPVVTAAEAEVHRQRAIGLKEAAALLDEELESASTWAAGVEEAAMQNARMNQIHQQALAAELGIPEEDEHDGL